MAKLNPFRFSTIYQDDETDLLMYLHRPYSASQGRFLSRDPLGDTAFFSSYSDDIDDDTLDRLASSALGPVYCFNANNSISAVDFLGLETVPIIITTVIRPPDTEAGVKTIHTVVVDDTGKIIPPIGQFIGTTDTPIGPVKGSGTFRQSAYGRDKEVVVSMYVQAHSALLPKKLSIRYQFQIVLNFCTRKGNLSGVNERYPSYNVVIKGNQIYDFQQQRLIGLSGSNPVGIDKDFKF